MASIESNHARSMFELLKASTPVVEIGDFAFEETGSRRSPACTIFYKGERILRRNFEDISPDDVIDLLEIPYNFDNSASIGETLEWEHINETEYLREWRTPLDENIIRIEVEKQNRQKSFRVYAPVEDHSTWKGYGSNTVKDVAKDGRKFEQMEAAFIYVANYMQVYNPYEVDRLVRMEDIAREEFLNITGVGDKTVDEIVNDEHIRSYKEFKQNISVLSRNYRDDAKDDLNARINQGEKISENSHVQEVSAKIAVDHL